MRNAFRFCRRAPLLVAGVLLVVAGALPAAAQQQLGAIQGTITDQTGGVLPGVTISVTNLATGVTRTATTNQAGVYRMPSLDPGRYEVAAELAGFRKAVEKQVTVSVGATVGLDFQLQPGQLNELVEVTGRSEDIQTEKADVSAVVEQKKIVDLPLVGRNPLALAALQPGVVGIPATTDFLAAEQGTGLTANGQRESGNSATVDGINIDGGPWGGTFLVVPNVEAVQEFQVIANNPSAEYGRNSGMAISIITKSGTNQVNGSGFEFHRDKNLRSKGIFETTKPDFNRNDFGFSVGGPIRRDRTFFFGSYEGVRETSGQGAAYTVESEQLVNWVMANRPNSLAAKLLSTYKPPYYPTDGLRDLGSPAPGANKIGAADGIPDVGTINVALINHRTGDQYNARVDQALRGGNDHLRGSYYLSETSSEFLYVRPQFNHPYPFRNQLFTSSYTRVISNQTLNETTFGWVRQHGEAEDVTPEAPTIGITNVSAGFGVDFWHPINFTQNNYIVKDTLTMNRGTHSFRSGGELRLGRDFAVLHHWERPNYTFSSILDFADDEPFSETRAVDPATGQSTVAPGQYNTNEWALFIQDNWKPRANLTLNLGLRYENFGNPKKAVGAFNAIELGSGSTRQEQMVTAKVAAADSIYKTDWNNLAPKAGIAWDPTGDGKTVVRGGAGISYNRINNTVYSDERLNPPQFAQASTNIFNPVPIVYTLGPNYPPNPALGRGVDANGGIIGARVALRVIDPNIIVPKSYNWFGGVQRELPWNLVLDVNYVGSAGRHFLSGDGPGGEDYNRFNGDLLDGRQDRLNPSFASVGLAESRISTKYNGLTTQVIRRYQRGFAVQVAYTLSKVTDMAGFAQDVLQPQLEIGPADYDRRHVFKTNVMWEIPYNPSNTALRYALGGWQVNAITVYQSGAPFSVTCNTSYPTCDFNADGYAGERVNMPSYGTDLGSPSQEQWLAGVMKAADFTLPARMTLGDQPRNAFRGPGYFNTDFSLFKNIPVPWFSGNDAHVQLRLETFNLFNHVNLNNPVSNINNTNFGKVTSTRAMRVIQLGAKVVF